MIIIIISILLLITGVIMICCGISLSIEKHKEKKSDSKQSDINLPFQEFEAKDKTIPLQKVEAKDETIPVNPETVPRDLLEKTIHCSPFSPLGNDDYSFYKIKEKELFPLIRKDLLKLIEDKKWDEITVEDIEVRAEKMAIKFFYLAEGWVIRKKDSKVWNRMTLDDFAREIRRHYLDFCANIKKALKVAQNSKEV